MIWLTAMFNFVQNKFMKLEIKGVSHHTCPRINVVNVVKHIHIINWKCSNTSN
jgi:hypothetical protein